MLALIPQSGDSSLCLGRLGLPDRLPFSKPKVNWLLHTRSAFRRTPSGRVALSQLAVAHRKPIDVLEMSYGGREACREFEGSRNVKNIRIFLPN